MHVETCDMELVGTYSARPLQFHPPPDPSESASHKQRFWSSACAPTAQQLWPPNSSTLASPPIDWPVAGTWPSCLGCTCLSLALPLWGLSGHPAYQFTKMWQNVHLLTIPSGWLSRYSRVLSWSADFCDFHSYWQHVGSLRAGPHGRLEEEAFACWF